MDYVPAAVVLILGVLATVISTRQRNPRVPFIAILALIVLTVAATLSMLVAFDIAA